MDSPLLSVREVAGLLNVSECFVRDRCLRGDLPAMKFGRRWRISEEAISTFTRRSRWVPATVSAVRSTGLDQVAARFNRARREAV